MVYTNTNLATDQNQLTMEALKQVAYRHNLACLLHEKPFAGVNGSGKHNNWSLATNTGINLLEPGESPRENAQFLLFLSAVIQAVDDYQDLLRMSVATASNDHRLGANEAPPAILSIFLGDQLTAVLRSIVDEVEYQEKGREVFKVGAHVLPRFPKDVTDRNRTSPFAFTGNKFEFRMLGSSLSIAGPNIVLNTIVAESLRQFADRLEGAEDLNEALHQLIRDTLQQHRRIVFNGNSYSSDWDEEAARRGLSNLRTAADALPAFRSPKSEELFTRHKIFTSQELHSRCDIMLDQYCKQLQLEARTMIFMARRQILPAVSRFSAQLTRTALDKQALGIGAAGYEEDTAAFLSKESASLLEAVNKLEADLLALPGEGDLEALAGRCRDVLRPDMERVRSFADRLEEKTGKKPGPSPPMSSCCGAHCNRKTLYLTRPSRG